MVSELDQVLGTDCTRTDSIMNDESGHLKRSSPTGGRPDDADANDYDRRRDAVGDHTGDSDVDSSGIDLNM